MSKECVSCNNIKELDDFFFRKDTNKYREKCKKCMISDNKFYRRNNKTIIKTINSKWENNNKEKVAKTKKVYRQNNKGKCNALAAKRRTSRLNAALKGFEQEILSVYNEATKLQRLDGIKRHVHHILPLQQFCDVYCGLHVPWNLEILTEEEHIEAHKKLLFSIRII